MLFLAPAPTDREEAEKEGGGADRHESAERDVADPILGPIVGDGDGGHYRMHREGRGNGDGTQENLKGAFHRGGIRCGAGFKEAIEI